MGAPRHPGSTSTYVYVNNAPHKSVERLDVYGPRRLHIRYRANRSGYHDADYSPPTPDAPWVNTSSGRAVSASYGYVRSVAGGIGV